jgi:hypothetical protein
MKLISIEMALSSGIILGFILMTSVYRVSSVSTQEKDE